MPSYCFNMNCIFNGNRRKCKQKCLLFTVLFCNMLLLVVYVGIIFPCKRGAIPLEVAEEDIEDGTMVDVEEDNGV